MMSWKQMYKCAGAQLQKINPAIVRLLIHSRARAESIAPAKGPTIIFSPHKDDEVLGCGGLIIKKRRMGEAVYLAFMTDGCAGHLSHSLSPAALAALRSAEARSCAKVMGVPEENIFFLEFEERFLSRHIVEAQRRVVKILRKIRPAEIYVPYHREDQPDHRETNLIVCQALQEYCEKDRRMAGRFQFYEYFVWTTRLAFWQIQELYGYYPKAWRRLDVRDVRQIKNRALAQYKSKNGIIAPHSIKDLLPSELHKWFAQPCEYFLKAA